MRSISKILAAFFTAIIIAIPTTLFVAAPSASAATKTFGHLQSNTRDFTASKDTHLHMRVRVSGRFPGTARLFIGSRAVVSHRLDDGVARFTVRRSQLPDNKRTKVTIKVNPDPRGRANTAVWTRVTDRKASAGAKVVKVAKAQVGDRYQFGKAGPSRFDCSGLVRYSYKKATGKNLPHSSSAIRAKGKRVSKPRVGDVVYTKGHVSIYLGHGKVVEAARPGTRVRIVERWQRNPVYLRF